ncbi:MAG: hypothetical protein KDD62_00325 [Bdellovibrionales bacterium]|nr:hypothetical protein [Bdellovibrionales bacterium]
MGEFTTTKREERAFNRAFNKKYKWIEKIHGWAVATFAAALVLGLAFCFLLAFSWGWLALVGLVGLWGIPAAEAKLFQWERKKWYN